MCSFTIISFVALFAFIALASGASWTYSGANGPSAWPGLCNTGQSQSPVDIVTEEVQANAALDPLKFVNYNASGPVEVSNNGHGVEVTGFANWPNPPTIEAGGLGARYTLVNAHFHWDQSGNGSEHQLDGVHFPVELHMVHTRQGLTLTEALRESNGLAVVGVFYRIGSRGTALATLESAFAQVVEESEIVTQLDAYTPGVLLPSSRRQFFRYNGSLTTPECQEAVVWTVLARQQQITAQQLELLRAIHGDDGQPLETNVRPVQPLNGRQIQQRA